jgi:prophage regulatory protein
MGALERYLGPDGVRIASALKTVFVISQKTDRKIMQTKEIQTPAPRRLLRLKEVQHQVGLGRSAIYDKIKRGEFPSPVSLGARAVAWPSDAIDAWIDERIALAGIVGAGR